MGLRYRIADLRGRGEYSHFADEYQCIFIHIPKAAGTSVARTLFGRDSRHVPYFEYERTNPRKFRRYFKFAFVRNPWDRLVSAFFFLRAGGMSAQERAWGAEHLDPFTDFDSFVRGWVNEDNIWTWPHFVPQHHFICDKELRIKVDFVGRVENLQQDFAYVANRLRCDRRLERTNASAHDHYSAYYNDDTRDIVRRVYARDAEIFGYRFESAADAQSTRLD